LPAEASTEILYTLITLVCLFPMMIFSQLEIDSLMLEADLASEDTVRLFLMSEVAEKLLYNNPVRARKINLQVIAAAA
jgi:hypothetical protein